MRIAMQEGGKTVNLVEEEFANEAELQECLERNPHLLFSESDPEVASVKREVRLPSGIIDLLLVDRQGIPVVVEVKLARNPWHSEVLAQCLRYFSGLKRLSFDQLDDHVGGKLDEALARLAGKGGVASLRKKCAASLHSGGIKLVLAVDGIRPDVVEQATDYRDTRDVRLVCISRFRLKDKGSTVLVSRILVPDSEAKQFTPPGPSKPPGPQQQIRNEFWNGFLEGPGSSSECPGRPLGGWLYLKETLKGIPFAYYINVGEKYIGFYLQSSHSRERKTILRQMWLEHKAEIEGLVGQEIETNVHEQGTDYVWMGPSLDANPADAADRQRQFKWLVSTGKTLMEAISKYYPQASGKADSK